MSAPLWSLDATVLTEGIRRGVYTAEEVVAAAIERVWARNDELNAVVHDCGDEAIEVARAADRVPLAERRGELFGVPVTVKVNIDVEGQATTNGLAALAGNVAPGDSAVTANLRRAGAIIIGRTNTPELSMRMTTWNPLHGLTRNPWHPDASCGGSSGGAGAACAAGMGPIHHGNDIGGSLRFPAFCNGVATIKPTQGRVPSFSPTSTAERGVLSQLMSSQGVICRSVADVRLGTRAISAIDPRDPWQYPVPWGGEPLPGPITVAVTRNSHGFAMHPAIAALIDRAAATLDDAGYRVVEVEPPPVTEAYRGWWSTGLTELELTLDATVRKHGSAELQQVFDDYYAMGELLDLAGYRAGFSDRTRMVREWVLFLEEHPLVLTPFLLGPTFAWNVDAGGRQAVADAFRSSMYSCSMNFLGLPAGVVPVGLVEALPAGVQLVGRRFREDVVLDAMQAIEDRVGRLSPPEPRRAHRAGP